MTLKAVVTAGAPKAMGAYSQGIDAGNLVFVAGQLGRDPVTGDLAEGIGGQTDQVLRNIAAILDAAGLSLADVAKTTVFLSDIGDFQAMNEVYLKHMGNPKPARSTFAVKTLPGEGALVEIEAIAVRS